MGVGPPGTPTKQGLAGAGRWIRMGLPADLALAGVACPVSVCAPMREASSELRA